MLFTNVVRIGMLKGSKIILFFFTNSKSDKKHKFSTKFEVIRFFSLDV